MGESVMTAWLVLVFCVYLFQVIGRSTPEQMVLRKISPVG